jgi:hypothetical protein
MSLTRMQLAVLIIGIAVAVLIVVSPPLQGAALGAAAVMTIVEKITRTPPRRP